MATLELTKEEFIVVRLAVATFLNTDLSKVNRNDLRSVIVKISEELKKENSSVKLSS